MFWARVDNTSAKILNDHKSGKKERKIKNQQVSEVFAGAQRKNQQVSDVFAGARKRRANYTV